MPEEIKEETSSENPAVSPVEGEISSGDQNEVPAEGSQKEDISEQSPSEVANSNPV